MLLIYGILAFLCVFALMFTAERMLRGETGWRWSLLNELPCGRFMVAAAAVGAVVWLAPKMKGGLGFIALLMVAAMVVFLYYLTQWFRRGGSNLKEVVVFCLMALVAYFAAMSAASAGAAILPAGAFRRVTLALPNLAFWLTVGYIVGNALLYQAEQMKDDPDDEKKAAGTAVRLAAWVVMLIVTVILLNSVVDCFFENGLLSKLHTSTSVSESEAEESTWSGIKGWFSEHVSINRNSDETSYNAETSSDPGQPAVVVFGDSTAAVTPAPTSIPLAVVTPVPTPVPTPT